MIPPYQKILNICNKVPMKCQNMKEDNEYIFTLCAYWTLMCWKPSQYLKVTFICLQPDIPMHSCFMWDFFFKISSKIVFFASEMQFSKNFFASKFWNSGGWMWWQRCFQQNVSSRTFLTFDNLWGLSVVVPPDHPFCSRWLT